MSAEAEGLRRRVGENPSSESPAPDGTDSSAKANRSRVKATVVWGLQHIPHFLVAGSFTGSAIVMKLLPYFGYALPDKAFKKAVLRGYKKFVALPFLNSVLAPLNISHKTFMLLLAIFHLIAVALLVLPKRPLAAHVVGFYVMFVMIGAEYCTRQTGFVPPGTPPEYQYEAQLFGSFFHLLLFVCGILLNFPLGVFAEGSLGLWPAFTGLFHVSRSHDSEQSLHPTETVAAPPAAPAAPPAPPVPSVPEQPEQPTQPAVQATSATSVAPADSKPNVVGSKKRDSTPGPTTPKASQSNLRRGGSAAARGADALNLKK